MFAFLSNQSALEALRYLGNDALPKQHWPQTPRRLPRWGDCVSKQMEFKAFCQTTDLAKHGISSVPVDLLVPEAGDRSRGKRVRFHVWKHSVPAGALLRLDDSLFASTPEFVLLQMAARNLKSDPLIDRFLADKNAEIDARAMIGDDSRPVLDDPFEWARKEQLLQMALVACEFSGTYRLAAGDKPTTYKLKPLMACSQATDLADSIPHLYGKSRVRDAVRLAFDRSASPMETALALMLSLPREFGGYGLPKPILNKELPTGVHAGLWDGGNLVKPDLLWESSALVIEYESDEFHAEQGRTKAASDATRANVLSAMGYTVLRAATGNVASLVETDRIACQVAAKLDVGIPAPDELTLLRRRKLHALLMRQ